jgi:hypothetical protein
VSDSPRNGRFHHIRSNALASSAPQIHGPVERRVDPERPTDASLRACVSETATLE